MFEYPAHIKQEPLGFVVTFPDFGFGVTDGDTLEEALINAVDLLDTLIEMQISDSKEPLPTPGPANGRHVIRPTPQAELKAALHNEMMAQKITKSEMARRLNIAPPNFERVMNFKHKTKLETLSAAFAALGKRLEIRVV
jgi:antitoxin HicB